MATAAGPAGNSMTTMNEWLDARKWLLFERGLNFLYDELKDLFGDTPVSAAAALGGQALSISPIGNVSSQYNFRTSGTPLVQPPTKFRP